MNTVVKGTRRALYCGPVAIAAVTGKTCGEVLRTIDALRNNPRNRGGRLNGVRGMYDDEVRATLRVLGFNVRQYRFRTDDGPVTLARLIREGLHQPQIMDFSDHWFAVDRDHYVCSHTKGQLVPLRHAPYKRRKVISFMDVTVADDCNPLALG